MGQYLDEGNHGGDEADGGRRRGYERQYSVNTHTQHGKMTIVGIR